ncbi:MAG: phosphohistidine phosphatase SixA [candidate division Zixibacteria bacterium]|nr:phosphohistidine phosphatase SixA [candidate division Zixibacteria bacterium]
MLLYLVRHAQSVSKDVDPERPISEEGKNTAKAVASYIADKSLIDVRRILHSGKERARQTAEIFAESMSCGDRVVEEDSLEPNADPGIWISRLVDINDNLMITGHLPHLNRLATMLLSGNPQNDIFTFGNASVVCLERNESRDWHVNWMITADIL